MSQYRVIVIGASAGGVETLRVLTRLLPAGFPAPILITVHISADSKSILPEILSRAGNLPALHPFHEQPLCPGTIYIAPPGTHLLVKDGAVNLSHGAKENGYRPAIDTLFRSAALAYGPRVIGVVLTGALDDGTAGLSVIKAQGGIAIVQDPKEATYPSMPQSAIDNVDVDYVLPISEIATLLFQLAQEPFATAQPPVDKSLVYEADIAELNMNAIESRNNHPGILSSFICPECGGSLWEINEDDVLRFRCHVGHAYSAETFMSKQNDAVESALWVALRVLEDNMLLAQRMSERASDKQRNRAVAQYETQVQSLQQQARVIRDVLARGRTFHWHSNDDANDALAVAPKRSYGE